MVCFNKAVNASYFVRLKLSMKALFSNNLLIYGNRFIKLQEQKFDSEKQVDIML